MSAVLRVPYLSWLTHDVTNLPRGYTWLQLTGLAVYRFSAKQRKHDLRIRNSLRFDLEQVLVYDDQIRQFANLDRAGSFFLVIDES